MHVNNSLLPLVSIVIPVFNGSNFLREAVDSALSQTYENIEIIIVNDGSDDNNKTEEIALSYGNKVVYIKKANGGVASALNCGISKMKGEYFSWLSHDDIYMPNKISKQIEFLQQCRHDPCIIYSKSCYFDEDSNDCREIWSITDKDKPIRYLLTVESNLHGCSLLIPRQAFEDCGMFNEKLRTTQDYELWFRLARRYKFEYLDICLVKGRCHARQGSQTMRQIIRKECDDLRTLFVKSLTIEEVLKGTRADSLSVAYSIISINLARRGLLNSSRVAKSFAIRTLDESSAFSILITLVMLLKYYIVDMNISKLRRCCGDFIFQFKSIN